MIIVLADLSSLPYGIICYLNQQSGYEATASFPTVADRYQFAKKMEVVLEGFFTPRELASASGWPEKTIRSLIATKELRHIRLKRRFFVPSGALEEFIERKMVVPKPRSEANSEVQS